MYRHRKPPSQTGRTFLENHIPDIAAMDFFVVATVRLRLLYRLTVLQYDRRRVVHFNVASPPTAWWTARQVVEVLSYDEAPRFLICDRDAIHGSDFQQRIKGMGIEGVVIACRSPWQNPFVERLIGSVRRECLDHVIMFNEARLIHLPTSYCGYYHESRTHLSVGMPRDVPSKRRMRRSVYT